MRYKPHRRDHVADQVRRGRFCAHCRQPFRPTAGHQKYCSHRCRSAGHRARARVSVHVCHGCRCEYLVTQTGSPGPRSCYHSQECRQQAYRRRRKAREALARSFDTGRQDLEASYQVAPDGRTWRISRTLWGVRRQLVEDPHRDSSAGTSDGPAMGGPAGSTDVPD